MSAARISAAALRRPLVAYAGKVITEMTREELIEALEWSSDEIVRLREELHGARSRMFGGVK